MALTIFPVVDNVRHLKRCFDCDELKDDVDWYPILTTEDDGFDLPLCVKCIDERIN